ncbi:MAG: GGDEF domain-containing protein, partial [Mycobacterium sp.]|nr:GGDEF domain-containing protein [Mycobacterium sp.]
MRHCTGNPWGRSGLPARGGWLVVAGYSAAGALILASSLPRWHAPYTARAVQELVTVACLVFAAACAGHAARRRAGRVRFGWLALMTVLVGWAAGEIIGAVNDVRPDADHAMQPAAAEGLLLLYPIGAMSSLMALSHLSRRSPRRLLLDGLIVGTMLFVVSWAFVLEKRLREANGSQLVTLWQVCTDIVLATTAILMLSRIRPGDGPSRSLVAGGIAALGLADIVTMFHSGGGSHHTSTPADLARVAGFGAVALAGLCSAHEFPARVSLDETLSRSRLWLPYLPLLLAAVVSWHHTRSQMKHGPTLVALGTLMAAVLARQFVVLRENQTRLAEVAREAFRDNLTGLANRARFRQLLERALRQPQNRSIVVLCLDLDNFKLVNDALGHPAGDELLIRVAERLTSAVGETGTVARLGGDEFAILIDGCPGESQAAHRLLDAFRTPILIDGVSLDVRPSIGFTVATACASASHTVDQLLRHADLAMYAAKRRGGHCIYSFVPDSPLPRAVPPPICPTGSPVGASPHAGAEPAAAATAGGSGATRDRPEGVPAGLQWPLPRAWIALAGWTTLAALTVGGITVTAVSALHAGGRGLLIESLYPALTLSAAALIAVRAYRVTADRPGWALLAAGMACSAAGELVRVEYLASYPLVCAGLLLLTGARLTRAPIFIRLDFLCCVLAAAAAAAAPPASPIRAALTRQPSMVFVRPGSPWADLVLLALAAGLLPVLHWRKDLQSLLLAAGFLPLVGCLWPTWAQPYGSDTALNTCWSAFAVLMAMASWAPPSAAPTVKTGPGSYAVPVAGTVVALTVAVLGHDSQLVVGPAA